MPKIKLSEKSIKNIIRPVFVNEIVDLATGTTDFTTTRFEECPQIKIPPVFKDVFLNQMYGTSPRDIRNALTKHFKPPPGTSSTTWNNKTAAEKAQIINSIVSDEVINNILYLVSQFMNIAGVPAVFCKFLQNAIDEFAKILNLTSLTDFEKADKEAISDISGYINNHIKISIEPSIRDVLDATKLKDNLLNNQNIGITKDKNLVSNPEYNSTVVLFFNSHLLNKLTKLDLKQDPLDPSAVYVSSTSSPVLTPPTDAELKIDLINSYKNFNNNFRSKYSTLVGSIDINTPINVILDHILNIQKDVILSAAPADGTINTAVIDVLDVGSSITTFENYLKDSKVITNIENEYNLLDDVNKLKKKKAILTSYYVMINYFYQLSLDYILRVIPAQNGQPNFQEYYKNFPEFSKTLINIASQIMR